MADANDPADNPGLFKHMPHNLQKLVKAVGFPAYEGMPDDEAEIYELVRHGCCMTCKKQLGKDANFIVNRYGIVGGYCSGVCHSDMAVMGFLQETHDDITQKIKFRGGQGDEPDGDT